jgi:hypothetical protein
MRVIQTVRGELIRVEKQMSIKADTCGKFVAPKLQAAGWDFFLCYAA